MWPSLECSERVYQPTDHQIHWQALIDSHHCLVDLPIHPTNLCRTICQVYSLLFLRRLLSGHVRHFFISLQDAQLTAKLGYHRRHRWKHEKFRVDLQSSGKTALCLWFNWIDAIFHEPHQVGQVLQLLDRYHQHYCMDPCIPRLRHFCHHQLLLSLYHSSMSPKNTPNCSQAVQNKVKHVSIYFLHGCHFRVLF